MTVIKNARLIVKGRKGKFIPVGSRPPTLKTTPRIAEKDFNLDNQAGLFNRSVAEKEKLLVRVKEEAKTSKEYAKEGYISQAQDEARHAKFFKKEAKKIKEPKHKTYSFGESPGHYAVGWHTDWEYDTKELAEIRRSRLAKTYPDTRLRKGRGHRYAVQYFTP